MRSFAAIAGALFLAACGGGAQRATSAPSTPGPVTEPEDDPDPPVGELARHEDGAPVRAVTASSLRAPSSGFREDDPDMHSSPGPRFADQPLPPVTPQPPAKGCNPDKFIAEGKDKNAMGQHAQALAAFEKALVCVHDPEIEKYAVLAACNGKLYARARAHFIRLAEKDKPALAQICQGPSF